MSEDLRAVMPPKTKTASNNKTYTILFCRNGHQMQPIHHMDDQGKHYCPTGFVACIPCDEWEWAEYPCDEMEP